jgi:glyoxylase-like metal-dependent hydrolase (beta-lactamase superfamily II)
MRVFAFTCGWLTGPLAGFLAGEEGRLRVPVPCYLIDHPRGKVLFDTGLHPALAVDPAARLGLLAQAFDVELRPSETIGARLAALGVDPGDVGWIVNSHLHFDHVGGNAELPNARVVVQRPEWDAGHDPRLARRNRFDARDYDTGNPVDVVAGEHDLFGDGRVVCVPTYGHTPGHQSLLVRLDGGPILLAGDACYLRRSLDARHLPAIVHDEAAARAALERLDAHRRAGTRVFFGHDPEFWETVPQAPDALP